MIRSRRGLLPLVLALWAGAATAGTGDPETSLCSVAWEAGFLGRALGGSACWLADDRGNLRLEIRSDEGAGPAAGRAVPLAPLLDWRGRGWTLVLDAGGRGTANAWQEPWRPLEPAVGRPLAAVATQVSLAPGAGSLLAVGRPLVAPRFRREAGRAAPLRRRLQLPADGAAPSFRATFRERGEGRGARAETLELAWSDPAAWLAGGGTLEIRSSRRPGRLRLSGYSSRRVGYFDPETFAPFWPLREVLDLDGGISGTGGPDRSSNPSR